jgi:signal transduction histidine kinase
MRGELRISQQQQLAIERIAAFGTAASSISHDLRHYLAAVVANAEFLYEAEKLKLNRDEIYDEIKTASDQMIDLLDSLRELGREDGYIASVPGFLDQSVRRAIESVRARPELRSRAISISTSGDMNGVFDPRKLERAFFNLLLNACEATGQSQGQIKVEVASSEEAFEIRVADNGPGVPESIRSTLFNPFVSSGKTNGTGLGLAIVSKIVHDHGGRATVEHTSGAGTIFLVKLPRTTSGPVATDRATASSMD